MGSWGVGSDMDVVDWVGVRIYFCGVTSGAGFSKCDKCPSVPVFSSPFPTSRVCVGGPDFASAGRTFPLSGGRILAVCGAGRRSGSATSVRLLRPASRDRHPSIPAPSFQIDQSSWTGVGVCQGPVASGLTSQIPVGIERRSTCQRRASFSPAFSVWKRALAALKSHAG